jgi:hypothetical protein
MHPMQNRRQTRRRCKADSKSQLNGDTEPNAIHSVEHHTTPHKKRKKGKGEKRWIKGERKERKRRKEEEKNNVKEEHRGGREEENKS